MRQNSSWNLSFTSFKKHLFLDDVTKDQCLIYYYWNQNSIGVTNVGVALYFRVSSTKKYGLNQGKQCGFGYDR